MSKSQIRPLTREQLRNEILLFLRDEEDFVLTIKIAQGVFGKNGTRKDVNSVLDHELAKKGLATREADEPTGGNPRWKLTDEGKAEANKLYALNQ